jgi:hypothetical protein
VTSHPEILAVTAVAAREIAQSDKFVTQSMRVIDMR